MEGSHDDRSSTPKPPFGGSSSSWSFKPNAGTGSSSCETSSSLVHQSTSTVTELDRHHSSPIAELNRHDSIEPDFYWTSNYWNELLANPAPAPSHPRCPVQSHDAMQNSEQQTEMTREADSNNRFRPPKTPDARQEAMRQYGIMQQRCLDHSCEQTPCFDEACTFGLPQDSGCRYSEAFHKNSINPCIWGWGKIVLEHAVKYRLVAAMMTDLQSMAQSYRERHKDDQRFTGPALVRDPPDAPDDSPYYVVVRPSEQNR